MTADEYKAKYADRFDAETLELFAAAVQRVHDQCAAAKKFWDNATYEEKERALLEDLLHARCHPENPKHNPNACNSCGPINVALRMLREGKL